MLMDTTSGDCYSSLMSHEVQIDLHEIENNEKKGETGDGRDDVDNTFDWLPGMHE